MTYSLEEDFGALTPLPIHEVENDGRYCNISFICRPTGSAVT